MVTPFRRVAHWIARCIAPPTGRLGTLRQLAPTVVCLADLPDELLLRADRPALAPLAVAAHAGRKDLEQVALRAARVTYEGLRHDLANEQVDAILGMLDQRLRDQLARKMMEERKFYSSTYRRWYAQATAEGKAAGQAAGRAQGRAESVLAVLAARGLAVTDAQRRRVLRCTDGPTLDRWLAAAAVATSAREALAVARPARAVARRRRSAA